MDPAAQAAHMAKRLSLSREQQTQVQNILTNEQAQMKALNANETITHQQWLAQTKALHQQTQHPDQRPIDRCAESAVGAAPGA